MTVSETRVSVRRRDGVAVLDIVGDIDRDADEPLQHAYDQAVAPGDASGVLLNFGKVGYINSTGIAVIVGLLARARKERLAISAYGLTEHYRHIFGITRLSDFIGIYGDEDSAVVGASPADAGGGARAARGGGE
jgi:anti-anti-sigma factor